MNSHDSKKDTQTNSCALDGKKKQICQLFTTEKQHSSPVLVSLPSIFSPAFERQKDNTLISSWSQAYDGHFEEVGQIQEAGYTEVRVGC